MRLDELKHAFLRAGATRLFAKTLAENDNSKNQVYFGPGFQALNLFPNNGIEPSSGSKNPIFKASLDFGWLTDNGEVVVAPNAKLILYPQYPEVRFSGFLKGCAAPPSALMASRLPGRILFLAVTSGNRIIGYVGDRASEAACELQSKSVEPTVGVFIELNLPSIPGQFDSRSTLLKELERINNLGWIRSKQLDSHGVFKPCRAVQCGGYTLEAELGISKNSVGEPDFLGWEVKQHSVPKFGSLGAAITLMTPEPTGGVYKDQGVEVFIRRFGYPDKNGKPDRLNFGGIHRVGIPQASTELTLTLIGYDSGKNQISDSSGSMALVAPSGEVAASWDFSGLLAHWSTKHTRAVYVPSIRKIDSDWYYAYGPQVRLAQRTDPLRLLFSLAAGVVYYDPGIKLENISTKPKVKRRSQFRVASKNISSLYETVETVSVSEA
ncbi:MvaI/BcnI family restriction endonuclease [Haloferula chungangensis]|uniref:MvaI/BcnI family restriction endonuclease n=1 Tax=Haloferula chungangensis TaxID=1048331 RepID=A0ABW2L4N8_9BACT